jgi:hypothetical protein
VSTKPLGRMMEAAIARAHELQLENKFLEEAGIGQIGTSIPNMLWKQAETFIVNPSNVGTSILSRMVETDDTVSSAVQFKILSVLAKIGEYHHEKSEISDFVNDALKKLKGPTWEESLEAQLSSVAFGFSASEVTYGLDRKLRKIPVRISTYHPSTLAFEADDTGQITEKGVLQFILQGTQFSNPNNIYPRIGQGFEVRNPFSTPVDRMVPHRIPFLSNYGMVRIPRQKVIHHVNLPMLSFGSPYGKTAVRTAHLPWQLKIFFMKQMGIAGKRQASPMIWATAPQGQANVLMQKPDGTEEKVSPAEAVRRMLADRETDDAMVTGPENAGYKVEGLDIAANMDGFLNVLNALDVRMFRCFLIPSLVMTDGSAGNRALGDKHFQIVDRIAEKDADKVAKQIVNDMIEPMIRANFGNQDDYGKFKKRPQNLEERERLAGMYATLTTSGIMKNHVKNDLDYMRAELSLPEDSDLAFEGGDQIPGTEGDSGADPEADPKDKKKDE